MPQPQITGNPATATFGGLALPNGQGTMTNVNLNDGTSWFLRDVMRVSSNRNVTVAPLAYRARGVYTADDFGSMTYTLTMLYSEVSAPLGTALAKLSQGGEQQLSFDGSTYVLAKFAGTQIRRSAGAFSPTIWDLQLAFICREPWFKDIASTTSASTNVTYAPTTPPTASALAGGALAVGTYVLGYTFVTAGGETAVSPGTANVPMSTPITDNRTARIDFRAGSRGTGVSVAQASMNAIGSRSRMVRGINTSYVVRQANTAIVLTAGNQQISVGAITLPGFATAVKWYFLSGPTTGFTVQNANGNAFTLNTAGNSVNPPATTPATSASVTYAGSVFSEPVWTITIPSSNPSGVQSMVLTNTMSTEALTVNFPPLVGGKAWTLTVDSANFKVSDQAGAVYDYSGSFPMLYPPAGQANAYTLTLTGSNGPVTGASFQAVYTNRWEL